MTQLNCIGITCYAPNEKGELNLPDAYVNAVVRSGGVPVLLPPEPTCAAAMLLRLDGLILAGGGDIEASRYGGEAVGTNYKLSQARDEMELSLFRLAQEAKLPLLAICRGMQIANIALGGDLYVHLPDDIGETLLHRSGQAEAISHTVCLETGSTLAQLMGAPHIEVASWHHQALKQLGHGVRVVASAEDGVIEAIEIDDYPNFLGVQWHPELTAASDALQQRLFSWLVER